MNKSFFLLYLYTISYFLDAFTTFIGVTYLGMIEGWVMGFNVWIVGFGACLVFGPILAFKKWYSHFGKVELMLLNSAFICVSAFRIGVIVHNILLIVMTL